MRLIYMLVFNGSKCRVKPCNVESRSVHVVKCENDEAKIGAEMSLHLTVEPSIVELVFLSALMKARRSGIKVDKPTLK